MGVVYLQRLFLGYRLFHNESFLFLGTDQPVDVALQSWLHPLNDTHLVDCMTSSFNNDCITSYYKKYLILMHTRKKFDIIKILWPNH